MTEITVPKLGLTMESARVVRWEFRSGDEVREGETVLVIETDKVTFEVEAPASGIIHPVVREGSTCAVEETVGYVAKDRQDYERLVREHPLPETGGPGEDADAAAKTTAPEAALEGHPDVPADGRIKASPLARSMAAARNLDLSIIAGTGPGGRIVRADVLRILEGTPGDRVPGIGRRPPGEEKVFAGKEALETIPVTGARKVIFDNMFLSLSRSAQLTLHTETSATALQDLRDRFRREGDRVSYNAVLIKVCAMALRRHPRMNAGTDGEMIRIWRQVHIGLAMEMNDALIVPVVRSPDMKTIREIDEDIKALVRKTAENRLSPDDLVNGTFTITNLGFADVDYFTPIIRPPESAILGVGRILKKPVVKGDLILPEARIGLSLTFDHRIIDGAPAARFLKTISEMIEDPLLMLE